MATTRILKTYIQASLIFLVSQVLLDLYVFVFSKTISLATFKFHIFYFISPLTSAVLVLISYPLLKLYYKHGSEHYFLHFFAWGVLFIPQLVPTFYYGLNIIYTTWAFVMSTTVAGTIAFHDLFLMDAREIKGEFRNIFYEELRFYFDKVTKAWLTLGTILAVAMTILWTAPLTSFQMRYDERVLWAVYMLFCFLTVSVLVALFVAYPIIRTMRGLRTMLNRE